VANFLKKGSLAGVDGRIQTRHHDPQDGGKRQYFTEVVADSVQFLEPKSSTNGNNGQAQQEADRIANQSGRGSGYGGNTYNNNNNQGRNNNNQDRGNNRGFTRVDDDPFSNNGQIDISDDDLPF
jgi:single-strand DNA-binding protein